MSAPTPYETVLDRLEVSQRNGVSASAKCPSHPDSNPSLTVTEREDGAALIHCHAGCSVNEVVAAIGMNVADLFPPRVNNDAAAQQIVATYDYTDEAGELLYQVVRYEPKTFRQRRPDGHGGWIWSLRDTTPTLYRLPEVIAGVEAGRTVFVAEGEKDVEALVAGGEIATCGPMGAGKWHKVSTVAVRCLRGADVVVVADKDDAGRKHARDIAQSLHGIATHTTIVEADVGKDAADHLGAGRTVADLDVIASTDPTIGGRPLDEWLNVRAELAGVDSGHAAAPFEAMRIGLMAASIDAAPRPRFLVRGLIVAGDYGVLGAEKKYGKTFAAGDLGVNVAGGGCFLGRFSVDTPGPVLLFSGEGGRRKIVRRARAIAESYGHDIDTLPLYVYERAPKLADLEQVQRLRATVETVAPVLVIVDPAYLALAGAKTSQIVEMGVLLERAQHVCQDSGAALLLTHHWNKTGSGTASDRFTGAGFAEWGRILLSGSTKTRKTDPTTKATTAVCKLEIVGDEVADADIIYRRRVWVDDPDDLASPMHYSAEVLDDAPPEVDDETAGLPPAAVRVLRVLRGTGVWLDYMQIGDALANTGHPLQKRTILEAGQTLVSAGLAEARGGEGGTRKTFRAHLETENVL